MAFKMKGISPLKQDSEYGRKYDRLMKRADKLEFKAHDPSISDKKAQKKWDKGTKLRAKARKIRKG
jgi:RNase H-fold protein (predicted Holliday junction resolvase)